MNAADKHKTTAWASGRTWCAAQVVIIDGITAWKVYNVKFSKKRNCLNCRNNLEKKGCRNLRGVVLYAKFDCFVLFSFMTLFHKALPIVV